jgi:hypothetical protein
LVLITISGWFKVFKNILYHEAITISYKEVNR